MDGYAGCPCLAVTVNHDSRSDVAIDACSVNNSYSKGLVYCTKEKNVIPHFYGTAIAYNQALSLYNLDYSDFEDMKNGEIREVFLNMED